MLMTLSSLKTQKLRNLQTYANPLLLDLSLKSSVLKFTVKNSIYKPM